ncbi:MULTISPECIES: REP-associated tyrosine transposase [Pseudoalteromonas]|nr:transposase [Pseudoalteromonas porphyrae]
MKNSHNLRKGRISLANHYYCVTIVTYHREALLMDLYLNRAFICEMKRLEEEGAAKTIAFVFMPDHIHWLFQLQLKMELSGVIRTFKGRTTKIARMNAQLNKFWQPDYYDHLIRNESDLINYARYIVANPLRGELVKNVSLYPYWDCIYIN